MLVNMVGFPMVNTMLIWFSLAQKFVNLVFLMSKVC